MRFGSRISDDRGHKVRTSLAGLSLLKRHSDLLSRSRARAIERAMAARPVRRLVVLSTLIALPFFFLPALLIPWVIPMLIGRIGFALAILIGAPLGVAGPLVMGFTLRAMMLPRIVRAYVRAGFCGCCGFPLEGLETQADACTLCPECGSAWAIGSDQSNSS